MGLITLSENDKKNLKEFLTYSIQNKILIAGDSDVFVHECPNCKRRYPFTIGKPMAVDNIVNFIMEIQEGSDAVKISLLNMMCNKLDEWEKKD